MSNAISRLGLIDMRESLYPTVIEYYTAFQAHTEDLPGGLLLGSFLEPVSKNSKN